MATYAPYLVPTGSDKAGGWVYSPNYEMVLIMLEELGMPILHVDGYIEDVNHQFERLITADYAEGLMSASRVSQAPRGWCRPRPLQEAGHRVSLCRQQPCPLP